MMLRIENVGLRGINSDTSPDLLPPEAWTSGQNVRFVNDRVEKIDGHVGVLGTPSVPPHWLLPWPSLGGYYWIYPSTTTIYRVTNTGTTHTNVTRLSGNYAAGSRPIWSGGILGGIPILNNNGGADPPQQWDSTANRFKDLDNWPASTYCRILRVYREFLVALDVTTSGIRDPYRVKWSHPADPNTVPVSWDENDDTKNAGSVSLASTSGGVLDCLPLGDTNIIYKEDAIWGMQFIGGSFIFRFYEILLSQGILAPRCVKEFFRRHFVVGSNDIVLFDGQRAESIISGRLRRWFFNRSLSGANKLYTFVLPNFPRREMWVCFVEEGSTYVNKALVWNWEDNVWGIRDLPDVTHIGYGSAITEGSLSFDGSVGTTFNNDLGAYGQSDLNPTEFKLLFASALNNKFYQGDLTYNFDGAGYTTYVERLGLTVAGQDAGGNPRSDSTTIKLLRGVYPRITADPGVTVDVYVGAQSRLDEPMAWQGPYTFNPQTDTKVNCLVNGKYLGIRFASASSGAWALSGYTLDIEPVGYT